MFLCVFTFFILWECCRLVPTFCAYWLTRVWILKCKTSMLNILRVFVLRLKLIGVLITHFLCMNDVQQSELYIFIACNFLFLIVLVNEKVCVCMSKEFQVFPIRVTIVPVKWNGICATMIIKKWKNFKADFDFQRKRSFNYIFIRVMRRWQLNRTKKCSKYLHLVYYHYCKPLPKVVCHEFPRQICSDTPVCSHLSYQPHFVWPLEASNLQLLVVLLIQSHNICPKGQQLHIFISYKKKIQTRLTFLVFYWHIHWTLVKFVKYHRVGHHYVPTLQFFVALNQVTAVHSHKRHPID